MTFNAITRIALAATTLVAASAHAASLQNGSFSAGLSNWTTVGDVTVLTGPFAGHAFGATPTLVLGTASLTGEDDTPSAAGTYNVSGTSAALAGQANGAEVNLGLPTGAFASSLGADDAFDASTAAQSFFVNAGDTISFTWQVLTRDAYAGNGDAVNDSAWLAFSLAADTQQAATVTQTQLGNIGTLALTTGSNDWRVTAVNTFSFTATTGGSARLGWGVSDVTDRTGTTLLAIQNVSVQAAAVPEPATIALLLAALGLIGLSTLRRGQR
jgi:hypothetical protein